MKATDEEVKRIVRGAKPLLKPAPERAARVREALREQLAIQRVARSKVVAMAVTAGAGIIALLAGTHAHEEQALPGSAATVTVEAPVVAAQSLPPAPPTVAAQSLPPAPPAVAAQSLPPAPSMTASALVPSPANPEKRRSSPHERHERHENGQDENDSLEREIALLREARLALAAGDWNSALRALDRHTAEHPRGALSEERQAMRVIALCALGREDEARHEARAFEQSSPQSPHIARLRQSCAHREEH